MFYELSFDQRDWYRYNIEGSRKFAVPPLLCEGCGGPQKYIGESYSGVEITRTERLVELLAKRAIRMAELEEIRAQLRQDCPSTARLTPGTRLGTFTGTVSGRPLDVCWHQPWSMFFREDTVERLLELGVSLPTMYSTSLLAKAGKQRTDVRAILHPEVGLGVAFSEDSFDRHGYSRCGVCGAQGGELRDKIVDESSYDSSCGDLMRVRNSLTRYVVTERFAHAVVELRLTGVRCVELRTA